MFRSNRGFDTLLDKATSNLLMEPDWPLILQICDLIRQNDVQPKHAINAIKKKLIATNPHSALYALQVLESMVKNCGGVVHEELTSKSNCEFLHELAKTTTHENVRAKLLELIQAWTFAFRKNSKYGSLKETMNLMKAEGFKFPVLRESDAMFSADLAPEWADGDVCHRCRVVFNLVQRKHHCRACGQVFCGQCSQKNTSLPKFGIEKEVRVCDSCYEQVTKPSAATKAIEKNTESELPAEYLKSSLAQQSQVPPRKNEDELREEEELQLAIALSQSEAEHKEKEKMKLPLLLHSNMMVQESRPRERSPSPPEDQLSPELARYLNRTYWENRQNDTAETNRPASPSAPAVAPLQNNEIKFKENGIMDPEMGEFVSTLKSQVEIFINRMKSNSSRGRSITNDSSVQTLFMNITGLHSQLLRYIQQHDDSRLYYERLQDKLTQVKDARAALDALRDEHREKLRRQAEEAERQRQLQMAHKLDIMRKKKQEYLQYQRQLALQRIQEQEREMQMRQEQQKQQYLMGSQYGTYKGSPIHNQSYPPNTTPGVIYYPYSHMGQPQVMGHSQLQGPPGIPQGNPGMPPGHASGVPQGPPGLPQGPPGLPQGPPGLQQGPPGMQQVSPGMQQGPPGMQQGPPGMQQVPPGMQQGPPGMQQGPGLSQGPHGMPPAMHQGMPQSNSQGSPQNVPTAMPQTIRSQSSMLPQPVSSQRMIVNSGQSVQVGPPILNMPQQFQQPGAPPASPQIQNRQNSEAETAELISFD